jgi:hypothetical protein
MDDFGGFPGGGSGNMAGIPGVGHKKIMVDMLGHIIFFGDFLLQFIFLIVYFKQGYGDRLTSNLLLTLLLIIGIIASAGVALAIYATIRHWHDQNFDIPTPSLGRYLPFIR